MIWYSDCIVTDQNNASLDLYTHSKLMLGRGIHIYRCGESIWSGVMDAKNKHIELPPLSEPTEHYTIVIADSVSRISFPFTAMKLGSDEPYIICDIDFTISGFKGHSVITPETWSVDKENKILSWTGHEYIVSNTGVASHPGDKGFQLIAEKIIQNILK